MTALTLVYLMSILGIMLVCCALKVAVISLNSSKISKSLMTAWRLLSAEVVAVPKQRAVAFMLTVKITSRLKSAAV